MADALARFEPVIGLEVHAQLLTRSKIFSAASAAFDLEHPNRRIDPYSIGLPGTLPVLNRAVVEMAIRAGIALGCAIRAESIFARKHYFYPDLPKGYQISQYERPLCEHGALEIATDDGRAKRVQIVRIHLEEDAGKNVHVEGQAYTLVDFNRAGVPLIEIVSAPDLSSAGEASRYLKALRAILMTLEVSDGNMQEGSFRADINVSLRPRGETQLGTRCEVKNVNSFRFVEQAIEHEIIRQARVLSEGGAVVQETRLFDSQKKSTRSLRSKEEAHDYRYFPDPDLPPLQIDPSWVEAARAALPELPAAKIARWLAAGVPDDAARTFADERDVAAFFDRATRGHPEGAAGIAHLIRGEILRELKDEPQGIKNTALRPEDVAELVKLKESGRISSTQQKKLLGELWRGGGPLEALVRSEGEQVSDLALLDPIIEKILADNAGEVAKFRQGKAQVLGFFVGQVMKQSGGKANPQLVKLRIEAKLKGGS
ncbi:MAG: Asp-tRNA(Asn)/Glu-tRNA(Gln) amidotransferase subunit GatB [Deltaproteobacteria bacterium]|nr:Asp-tRNA(Asn)/Glu-tRNA(Gln) amidotransferase subunit GatB [Deltaproteobacteria bacterium]